MLPLPCNVLVLLLLRWVLPDDMETIEVHMAKANEEHRAGKRDLPPCWIVKPEQVRGAWRLC